MAAESVVAAAIKIAASDLCMVGGWADGWTAGWMDSGLVDGLDWRMGGLADGWRADGVVQGWKISMDILNLLFVFRVHRPHYCAPSC